MATLQAVSAWRSAPRRGTTGALLARLRDRLPGLFNPGLLLFRSSEVAADVVIAHLGCIEVHQTLPGWCLETCVKGEPDQARATALRRLAGFVRNRNGHAERLHAARPLMQTPQATGRWLFRVGLADPSAECLATFGRNGKVRPRACQSETLAVIRVSGRPTLLAMQHAETAIRLALAPTRWEATGTAILRLHAPPAVLPFLGRFEVAVPVKLRSDGSGISIWPRVAHDAPTPSSPPVR